MIPALVSGILLLPPAIIGFVGVLASRAEPRRAKELQALNAIIEGMPDGDAGTKALEKRRSQLAVA